MAVAGAAPFALDAETVGMIVLVVFCFLAITVIDATRPSVVSAAGSVPLVGNPLSGAVNGAMGAVRDWLYNVMKGGLVAFSATVDWLHNTANQLADTLAGFAELATAADNKIVYTVLPALELRVTEAAQAAVSGIYAQALALVSAEDARLIGAVSFLEQEINDAESAALAYADSVGVATATEARALFATAETDAKALAATLSADIASGVLGVESSLSGALASAVATLEGEIGQVGAAADAGVSALERTVAGAQADFQALQRALAATGVLGAALSIPAIISAVEQIRNSRCLQNCDPLANLAEFSSALDPLILIAAAAAWRADQQSSHPVFAGVIASTVVDLENGIKQVAGLS